MLGERICRYYQFLTGLNRYTIKRILEMLLRRPSEKRYFKYGVIERKINYHYSIYYASRSAKRNEKHLIRLKNEIDMIKSKLEKI